VTLTQNKVPEDFTMDYFIMSFFLIQHRKASFS